MKKHEEHICGCGCGFKTTIQPLLRLHEIVEKHERDEAIRKAKENQNMLAALSRYVLDAHHNGSTES